MQAPPRDSAPWELVWVAWALSRMAAALARITPASTMPWPPKPVILTSFLLANVSLPLSLGQVVQGLNNLGALCVHELAPGPLALPLLGTHLVPIGLADEGPLDPVQHSDAVVAQLVAAAVEGGALGDDLHEAEALLLDGLLDEVDALPGLGRGGTGHVGGAGRGHQLAQVEAVLHQAVLRGGGQGADGRGGRVLAARHAVGVVVHADGRHVGVPAGGLD